ncbi:MAG: exo-alpha-sialidase [Opitutaceae bacterium]|nr:exo-alpha-sialidase [Opitutaceae bacterium]
MTPRHLIAVALAAVGAAAAEPVGVRLRPAPRDHAAIVAPVIVRAAPTNETCLVARRDGALELYAIGKPASDTATVMRSTDGGLTWTEPALAFRLNTKAYYAIQVLEAHDGTLHAVVHDYREGPGGYRGRLWEVYYARRAPGGDWTKPRLIVPGYIGSIRGFVQLKSGRLVLAVARAIPERMEAPKSGPDLGWHSTFVYFSDDAGATWRESPDQLSLPLNGPNATRYGAIEPALLELRDGRLWMLVRDRGGRLWQSYSADGGARWPALERSPFISSDSPAALLRLRDGKILLLTNACQNWTNPRSYAMGGREVLHAALSGDEGRTWRGFREILHEPLAETRGDRGTAYASAVENSAGKIVVVSGQGEGKRAILAFDPRWLEETETRDDFAHGPVQWTAYGSAAPRVQGARAVAVPVAPGAPGGAQWNFPLAAAGAIEARLEVPAGVTGVRLCLNDHFTRIDDRKAAAHAVFVMPVEAAGSLPLSLRWTAGELIARVGTTERRVAAQRPAQLGVNYLRVEFDAAAREGAVVISDLVARAR